MVSRDGESRLGQFVLDRHTIETILIFGLPIISVACVFTWLIAKTTSDDALKRSMVERGMSPDEIEQVMSGKSKPK